MCAVISRSTSYTPQCESYLGTAAPIRHIRPRTTSAKWPCFAVASSYNAIASLAFVAVVAPPRAVCACACVRVVQRLCRRLRVTVWWRASQATGRARHAWRARTVQRRRNAIAGRGRLLGGIHCQDMNERFIRTSGARLPARPVKSTRRDENLSSPRRRSSEWH